MLCSVLLYLCVCLKIDCSDQKLDLFADPAFLLAQLPNIHRKLNFYFWENWTHSQTSIGKLIRKIDFLINPGREERAELKRFIFCRREVRLAWVTSCPPAPQSYCHICRGSCNTSCPAPAPASHDRDHHQDMSWPTLTSPPQTNLPSHGIPPFPACPPSNQ